MILSCKTCAKEFHAAPSARRVYCSKSCWKAAQDALPAFVAPASVRRSCIRCGVEQAAEEFGAHRTSPGGRRSTCKACRRATYAADLDANRARTRESYHKHREVRRADLKDRYWAIVRGEPSGKGRRPPMAMTEIEKAAWVQQRRNYANAAYHRVRAECLAAYGGRCVCCGESHAAFLAIDHINGDGAEERARGIGFTNLYRSLKRWGFPRDRYQLLCHNCNRAKGQGARCPHRAPERLDDLTQLCADDWGV